MLGLGLGFGSRVMLNCGKIKSYQIHSSIIFIHQN